MRRSISYVDPKVALAGNVGTWRFIFTPGQDLVKGARLKFDLRSQGRECDWQIPGVNPKAKDNLIRLELEGSNPLFAKEVSSPVEGCSLFEFVLLEKVTAGTPLTICLGAVGKDATGGNRAQTNAFRRRAFYLYVDAKGKGEYKETETFILDVRGNRLRSIRVITPSLVAKNQRFDVVIRFEDEFGNLTGYAPEKTLIELSYEQLRGNMNWKLFVPETGFLTLPNFYFNEPGVYRMQLTNLMTKESFLSPPIQCLETAVGHLFWGQFHGASKLWNTIEQADACLRYQRDENAFRFFALSPFDDAEELSREKWKTIQSHVSEFNEDERFTAFLGLQRIGVPGEEGIRQIIYAKDGKSLLRSNENKADPLKKIYKSHHPKDFVSIPSFTMGGETLFDFNDFHPDYERVVEIYNSWGSSECAKTEGNPRPICGKGRKAVKENGKGSVRNALNRNRRFGFVAGGSDKYGIHASLRERGQTEYSQGCTAVLAKSQTRDEIMHALSNRSCYATTGPRIIIGFHIAEQPMGSILTTKAKPGLTYNRYITGFINGTATIEEILIIRNGTPYQTLRPEKNAHEFIIDDTDPLDTISLRDVEQDLFFTYYYVRVVQTDGHVAWGSPIWIDISPLPAPHGSSPTPGKEEQKK
ncbi:MAG: DUF3604 domain-containing protein [Simkaniaceae bacterium]|nr:DUF3604 domain-containing protein [Simkaniaceae bacterium]